MNEIEDAWLLDVNKDAIAFLDLPIGHYFYYDNRDQQLYRKESETLVVAIDDRDRVVSQHEPINCKLWDIGMKEW